MESLEEGFDIGVLKPFSPTMTKQCRILLDRTMSHVGNGTESITTYIQVREIKITNRKYPLNGLDIGINYLRSVTTIGCSNLTSHSGFTLRALSEIITSVIDYPEARLRQHKLD